VKLLLTCAVDVDKCDNSKETPLYISARYGYADIVSALLQHNADMQIVETRGEQPIHVAVMYNHFECVKVLIAHSFTCVNAVDNNGRSPIFIATRYGNVEILKFLIVSGGDLHHSRNNGKTPLHVAVTENNIECLELLLTYGADLNAKDKQGKVPSDYATSTAVLNTIKRHEDANQRHKSPVSVARLDAEVKATDGKVEKIHENDSILSSVVAREGKVNPDRMRFKYVLGKGSFGVVIGADYVCDGVSYPCALKVLSKTKVAEGNSLKQVLAEREILGLMSSPFVVSFVATYQTAQQLVFVTEELNYDDLLSVIYHTNAYDNGLSMSLTTFYTASLVLALSHIHSQGVAYRDLKPENIMLSSNGYLKVIDFGLAKRVPYTKVVANEKTVCHKTYTLCGTPEYLAPEVICNLGYDRGVDIWSLGVLLYEMIMQTTPFAVTNKDGSPSLEENITSLFTNIAMVKRIGVQFPEKWHKSVSHVTTSLVTDLLQGDMKDRLGYVEGTETILTHPFFNDFDIQSLKKCTMVPEHIPEELDVSTYESLKSLLNVRAYKGDQAMFKEF
jgi:serine/threonine protein kinase